jgi:hypothetical protein
VHLQDAFVAQISKMWDTEPSVWRPRRVTCHGKNLSIELNEARPVSCKAAFFRVAALRLPAIYQWAGAALNVLASPILYFTLRNTEKPRAFSTLAGL